MRRNNNDRVELNRRRFIGATGAGLLATGFSNSAGASSDGGDGGNGDGDGGDNTGAPGGNSDEHAVTLITGQTIHITDIGDERIYAVEDGDDEVYEVLERERGTYIVPASADTDLFDEELFNVDRLIDHGFTDAEFDATPVLVKVNSGTPGVQNVAAAADSRALTSIGAVAASVPKDEGFATDVMTQTAAVDQILLDGRYEVELDVSAPAIATGEARDAFEVDGSGVTIAIADSGIDSDHPDLEGRVVDEVNYSEDEGTQDNNGHGTHVAGIAAGNGTESGGEYVGVAPEADLMNVKVIDENGDGLLSDLVEGIEYAVDEGADIVNMSLGGTPQEDDPMEEAIDWAHSEGVVVITSAGNEGFGSDYGDVSSPGTAEGAITVGATDHTGDEPTLAEFTAYGPDPFEYRIKPDIVAPGVALTASGSEDAGEAPYTDKSGTSMSAPMVAGLVALLLEDDDELGPEDVRNRLVTTAEHVPDDFDGHPSDVYQEGAGTVDANAALGTDVVVRDAVKPLGVYDGPQEDEVTVTVENLGDDPVDLDASASLYNVQTDRSLDDNVDVSPAAVTVDPGATAAVTLTVDTTDTGGFNSGVVTFESDDVSYRSIFGFTTGFEVTVEKVPHENSMGDTVAGDGVWVWSHDGEINADGTLGADGTFTTLMFHEGGTFTVWSAGQLEPTEEQRNAPVNSPSGDPVHVVESGIQIDADADHVTLDENDTVPRELDTNAIEHHEPFTWREFGAYLYGTADGAARSHGRRFIGDYRVRTSHVSPIEEDDPTNIADYYLMAPTEDVSGETAFASPEIYYLFDGTLSIDEDGEPFVVEPDDLAADQITYHRDYEDQVFAVLPGVWPADGENFPSIALTKWGTTEPDLPAEQVWYRTDEGRYSDDWEDLEVGSSYGITSSFEDFVPEAGEAYQTDLNREPLLGQFSEWDLTDGSFDLTGHWYTDQTEIKRTILRWDYDNPNEYEITVDGDIVTEGTGTGWAFNETASGIDPGSTVELSTNGNAVRTFRGTSTVTRYETTYDPDGDNTPPQFSYVDVVGIDTLNEVAAGSLVVFAEASAELDAFDAYYADSVAETPFDDDAGWTEAEVLYDEGNVFGVRVDAAGYDELCLAFRGIDAAGNVVESTSLGGITAVGHAEHDVPITVRPNKITVGSNQTIPVAIEATDDVDPHAIDADSLRFGSPEAVSDGDGAPAERVQRLGNGTLQAQFRAGDTGYDEDTSPAAVSLVAKLENGTIVSGADVVETVEGTDSSDGGSPGGRPPARGPPN